jgi:hypothetical protein
VDGLKSDDILDFRLLKNLVNCATKFNLYYLHLNGASDQPCDIEEQNN